MGLFNNLSLRVKVLFSVAMACIICGLVSVSVAIFFNKIAFKDGLEDKARILHGRLDIAAKYVANQGGLKPIIEKYADKYKSSNQLTEEDKKLILQQVPIYAAMEIGKKDSEKDNYTFRVFSDEARNEDYQASPEEMIIFNKFKQDPSLPDLRVDDDESLTLYKPIRLKESDGCLTCHGHPSTSPWKDGSGVDILGYKMENWKDGKLHGVFAVTSNFKKVQAAAEVKGRISLTGRLIGFIVAGAILALLFAAFIVRGPVNTLQNIAKVLSDIGNNVGTASTKIASSSQGLSRSVTEQASSLEETASSIEEMSAMINKNTMNAKGTSENSSKSQKVAEGGQKTVKEMLESMNEIDKSNEQIIEQVNHSNTQMSEIANVILEIGKKTNVINDIVFQTKLLSFNASVEAARAGEHGKGFSVVAEEVGNLAQMSGIAAKEITEMLEQGNSRVESIVKETTAKVENLVELGKEKVKTGIDVANKCSSALEEIVSKVSDVTNMAGEISSANQEQSQGIGEINKAMILLDQVTQKNAASSEQAANSAEELSNQAEMMRLAVHRLIVTINGTSGDKQIEDDYSELTKMSQPNKSKKTSLEYLEDDEQENENVPDRNDAGFRDI